MTEEGEEDSRFVLAEAVVPAASDGGIGPLAVGGNNLTDGAEANDDQIYHWVVWVSMRVTRRQYMTPIEALQHLPHSE